jgi:hypothetical protein
MFSRDALRLRQMISAANRLTFASTKRLLGNEGKHIEEEIIERCDLLSFDPQWRSKKAGGT